MLGRIARHNVLYVTLTILGEGEVKKSLVFADVGTLEYAQEIAAYETPHAGRGREDQAVILPDGGVSV
jgi:hypothetical protein